MFMENGRFSCEFSICRKLENLARYPVSGNRMVRLLDVITVRYVSSDIVYNLCNTE